MGVQALGAAAGVSTGMAVVSVLMILQYLPQAGRTNYQNVDYPLNAYDFIIVGGGTAGCTLASRLSEVPSWRVLLLEAGGNPPAASEVPALYASLWSGATSYNLKIPPQRYSGSAHTNRVTDYLIGRGLGGGSGVNQMIFVRGNRRDFDNWAALGNEGWDYNSVLYYFKKLEKYLGPRDPVNDPYRGRSGPVLVQKKSWATPIAKGFLQAGRELGYNTIDPNGESQIGFSIPDMSIYQGTRWSSPVAYLRPILNRRPNLHVVLNARVHKVLFNKYGRAAGVVYEQNGQIKRVAAHKEVVLSAGTVHSPHVLMLSGIGPAQHLQQHKIRPLVNLPGVGQNLQDHPTVFGLSWTVRPGSGKTPDLLFTQDAINQYLQRREGPYSVPTEVEVNAWPLAEKGDPHWPDIQAVLFTTTPAQSHTGVDSDFIGYTKEFFQKYFGPIVGKEAFSINPYITRPVSRGTVTLASNDPNVSPIADPNYLSHPEDVDTLVRAIKFALQIGNTTALRKNFDARFHDLPLPVCEHLAYGSYDYWACVARALVRTSAHPAGTCKMAPLSDPYGVVDNRLRVRKVAGLRVVDASIMPVVTSGNLNAVVYMIAEKAADMIKQDYIRQEQEQDD
ncbi:glucose dehydrogenase [FAD, quinone]-like [Oratosquilla oratoria]|uniref:glucose dehydrogenase [FAD, quinone]-like n=1 Tax=Oratosquilla oratoria TaxID=337810 RepID=UPI003F770727